MKVIIRTDASETIGIGHVMRCLIIADELRKRNCSVSFLMKPLPGNLITEVKQRGYNVITTFSPADICIIDHYDIDINWEKKIRPYVNKIIVIDDLANRRHDCDVLLDQNLTKNDKTRYDDLVPNYCKKLLGIEYFLMREEFAMERKNLRQRTGELHRLLVFMGGSDPTNETLKVLQALQETSHPFSQIDVVVGKSNPQAEKIKKICKYEGFAFHIQVDYMAKLMHQADFSFGTGGTAMWERCLLALPSTSTIVAKNQLDATKQAAKLGVTWNLGWHGNITVATYKQVINELTVRKQQLKTMSARAAALTQNVRSIRKIVDIFLEDVT